MAVYDFRIGVGWNVALVSLTNVENLPIQGGRYKFFPPSIVPNYYPGLARYPGNGGVYYAGYPMVPWYFGEEIQGVLWYYLFNTINSGLYRNKVTIYTLTLPGLSSYSRVNAWMELPPPAKQATDFTAIPQYTINMTRLVASS